MSTTLEKKFATIGARAKISEPSSRFRERPISIDVRRDKEGEYFDIQVKNEIELLVLDVQKDDRHLLLMARDPDNPKAKFLCGHDERHWFTCAIPESAGVTNVSQAKQALKPKELASLESSHGIKTKNLHKRHRKLSSGKKIHRQGEFMFIPDESFSPPKSNLTVVLKNEPMRGGGSHFHYAQYLYRTGGKTVYVSGSKILEKRDFDKLDKIERIRYRTMVQDPTVYVKGKISHEEHATVDLGSTWHKVVVNTESQAKAAKRVAFLD